MLALVAISLTGCASAGADYYQAIERAANANAAASAARYEALAKVAQSNDPGAATAAVMAIALSEDTPILPQYVESSALKWASVLVPGATTLGGIWLQTDLAKTQSNNSRDIQMASFDQNTAIQLGQQGMVTDLGTQWAGAATAGGQAAVTLGLAGFDALNLAGDQTVSVATTGLNTADSIATTGFTTVGNVSTAGMAGMVTLGTTGITAVSDVGIAGMEGMNLMNGDWLNYSTGRDTTYAGTISDILSNYQATIAELNNTINASMVTTDPAP